MQIGVPLRLDRTNRLVEWLPYPLPPPPEDGSLAEPPAPFTAAVLGRYPPLLTECLFSDDGRICLGPLQQPDELLHDDFLLVEPTPGASFFSCDTNWEATVVTVGGAIAQVTVSRGLGSVLLTTATTLNAQTIMRKDDNSLVPPSAPSGLWFSGKGACGGGAVTQRIILFGFSDSANSDTVMFRLVNPGTAWTTQCTSGGSSTIDSTLPADTGPVADVFQDFDIVFVPGEVAAFWVNGDGPYITETNVPTAATSVYILVQNQSAGAERYFYADYVHVEALPVVIDPRQLKP